MKMKTELVMHAYICTRAVLIPLPIAQKGLGHERLRSKKLLLIVCVLSSVVGAFSPAVTFGDSFDWRSVGGVSYITTISNQGTMGSCWAFAAVGTLEAKYKLTRNDSSFNINLAEQFLISSVYQGGLAFDNNFFDTYGVVTEADLPYTMTETSSKYSSLMATDWQNRVVKTTSTFASVSADVTTMKTELKTYGPLDIDIYSGDLNSTTLGTEGGNHAVVVVGYADNSSYAGGGYWIIKNSWGGNDITGYYTIAYANVTRQGAVQAIEGPAYFTGTMYFSGTDYTEFGQLSYRDQRHRHLDRQQQQHLEHQRHQGLVDQWLDLHLGQPGSRGHLRQHGQHANHHRLRHGHRPRPDVQRDGLLDQRRLADGDRRRNHSQ